MLFCKDIDLLYWEPLLLREAAFASQVLSTGTGNLNGSVFTRVDGPVFHYTRVEAGHVLVLETDPPRCLAIQSAVGADTLNVTTLYTDILPPDGSAATPVYGLSASGVAYTVRTFYAQRKIVSDLLLSLAGLEPGSSAAQDATIINPQSLERAATLGTIQLIYSTIAAAATEPQRYDNRAELYERLYRRALRQTRVEIDTNGDGLADTARSLGIVTMVRE